MRTEQEMLDLVLKTAREDENIRLVGMNGSRANPRAPRDRFQDFDIVYLVRDMEPYIRDRGWIDRFGPRVILQTPEDMALFPATLGGWFTYLMQFEDGNRIDLMLIPVGDTEKYLHNDSQTVILLDKDGRAGNLPAPSDRDYWVRRPTEREFQDCCNEFWWLVLYAEKGIRRGELLYASAHLCGGLRGELLRMLAWKAGTVHGFIFSPGKEYKYMEQYMEPEEWQALCGTLDTGSLARCARALEEAVGLFRCASAETAQRLGYGCPDYDEKVTAYRKGLEVEE